MSKRPSAADLHARHAGPWQVWASASRTFSQRRENLERTDSGWGQEVIALNLGITASGVLAVFETGLLALRGAAWLH